jgi:hypothetical protein
LPINLTANDLHHHNSINMDHYPEVNVSEREHPAGASRHDSSNSQIRTSELHSPPVLLTTNSNLTIGSDSSHATRLGSGGEGHLEAEIAQYTDAPPSYSVEQYEGKSEEETSKMRMDDYAKEISRQMGSQLLRGVQDSKSGKPESLTRGLLSSEL